MIYIYIYIYDCDDETRYIYIYIGAAFILNHTQIIIDACTYRVFSGTQQAADQHIVLRT